MTGEELKRKIKSQMALYDYSNAYVATCMHIDITTWYKRLQHPERMKFQDVCKLDKLLKMGLFSA